MHEFSENNVNKIYTGIGSRKTPSYILNHFRYIGKEMADRGYLLRSGGADGADSAFESGCMDSTINDFKGGDRNIFLPWKGFNNNKSYRFYLNDEAYKIAQKFHPNWYNLSISAKKLMARNSYQVLGIHPCSNPICSDFIICYTKDGKISGGTGQALRIAKEYKIPIYNFGNEKDINRFYDDFNIIPYDDGN